MDRQLASNLRSFLRMEASHQDRFLSAVFSLLPSHRQQKYADFVTNFNKVPEAATASLAEESASASATAPSDVTVTTDSGCVITFFDLPPTVATPHEAQLLTRRRNHFENSFPPVVAVDVEYIKTSAGRTIIHSVAIASAHDTVTFFVARLPADETFRDVNLLVPSLRPSSVLQQHVAMDVSAIKATVRALIDGCQVILWQGDKDKAALEWPASTFTTDIVEFFRRNDRDKTPCSLRGIYYTFYREDIFKNGRDPRPSAKAIFRLFNEVVPHAHKFRYDNIVSNKTLNRLAAPESSSLSRRGRHIVNV